MIEVDAIFFIIPEELKESAGSLFSILDKLFSLSDIAAGLIASTVRAYRKCVDGNSQSDDLQEKWEHHDVLNGKAVTAQKGNETVTGVAEGVDSIGRLGVRTDERMEWINAGEVTLAWK